MSANKARRIKARQDGFLIAVIADEDTSTGFLLAGVGQNESGVGPNYFVVDPSKSLLSCLRLDVASRDC